MTHEDMLMHNLIDHEDRLQPRHRYIDHDSCLEQDMNDLKSCHEKKPSISSWNRWIYCIPRPRHLIESRHINITLRRQLMLLRPSSNSLIISTTMCRHKVYKRQWMGLILRLPPHLAQNTHIRCAHQHLPKYIQAMSRMNTHNIFAVRKRAFTFCLVVVVVPMQGFAQKILICG